MLLVWWIFRFDFCLFIGSFLCVYLCVWVLVFFEWLHIYFYICLLLVGKYVRLFGLFVCLKLIKTGIPIFVGFVSFVNAVLNHVVTADRDGVTNNFHLSHNNSEIEIGITSSSLKTSICMCEIYLLYLIFTESDIKVMTDVMYVYCSEDIKVMTGLMYVYCVQKT